jgi:hypothetical protein
MDLVDLSVFDQLNHLVDFLALITELAVQVAVENAG